MKKLIGILALTVLSGCVGEDVAKGYAERAHPECTDHQALNHTYTSGDSSASQTEVTMLCDGTKRSVTIKCIHGFGIISDTTCHENN
jgi:hypothetical protein